MTQISSYQKKSSSKYRILDLKYHPQTVELQKKRSVLKSTMVTLNKDKNRKSKLRRVRNQYKEKVGQVTKVTTH
jgi:ribosomal protein S8E